MLCKVKTWDNTIIKNNPTYSLTIGNASNYEFENDTITDSGYLHVTTTGSASGSNLTIVIYKNWTQVKSYSIANGKSTYINYTSPDKRNTGDVLSMKLTGSWSNSIYWIYVEILKYKFTTVIYKIKPLNTCSIWNLGIGFIFWVNDGKFYGGIMMEKSSSSSTGNIALGNAVGYIKVYFNWEYIKIPYYNE